MTSTIANRPWLSSYPAGLSWDKTYPPVSLPDMFDAAVDRYGPRICTRFLGRNLTYRQIGALVERAARGLAGLGIGKGSKVGLLLPNTPTYVVFYFAALKTGATVVNYNPLYSLPELRHQVKDSGTELMVTLDLKLLFDKVDQLVGEGTLRRAVVAPFAELLPFAKSLLFRLFKRRQIARRRASPNAARLITQEQVLAARGALTKVPIDPAHDIAVLQYTGGTTGTPKGAALTHANLTVNVAQLQDWATNLVPGEERIMGVLPFFHVFAMTTVLNFGIAHGMELILMPRFELDEALRLIKQLRPTVMPGVPTLYNAMLNHSKIATYDLSSLKFCISGGAALPVEVRQRFEKAAGCSLIEGYGLSETAPVVTANPVTGAVREGSIGLPMPATEVSIRSLDDPRIKMPLGEAGEICVRGPQVMPGYWNKPEETDGVFVDGFFRTGDVGYMAEDGFIYVVDRLKDMINASGFKIYPRQVEEAIYRHPAVEEVTVIGIPDDYRGEAPKAFIKLKAGHTATAEEITTFLKTQISKLELPAQIEFRDTLPKTMIGKLSRKELRQSQ